MQHSAQCRRGRCEALRIKLKKTKNKFKKYAKLARKTNHRANQQSCQSPSQTTSYQIKQQEKPTTQKPKTQKNHTEKHTRNTHTGRHIQTNKQINIWQTDRRTTNSQPTTQLASQTAKHRGRRQKKML